MGHGVLEHRNTNSQRHLLINGYFGDVAERERDAERDAEREDERERDEYR